MKFTIPGLMLLLVLSGCWAVNDIRENQEIDRSLAFQVPVRCGEISALTPQVYLLLENRGDEMILRVAASPRRYTAKPSSKEQFAAYIDLAKDEGKHVEICPAVDSLIGDVYLIRWEAGGKAWGEYATFIPLGPKGVAATYLEWGFPWQPKEETHWTDIPKFFMRFVGSLKLGGASNQLAQPPLATSG